MPNEIQVRCDVSLVEPIVLATQASPEYTPLKWTLSSGDQVVVRMDVAEKDAKACFAEHSLTPNYFVNTRVEKLFIVLTIAHVSASDISRLLGTNTSEKTFRAHFETPSGPQDYEYQSAEALGRRIAEDIKEATNALLRFIRINYGQHWLTFVGADEPELQNFLRSVRAKWSQDGKSWRPLLVSLLGQRFVVCSSEERASILKLRIGK